MPRLTIFLISFGLSGLTGWATGWGLQMGYWLVTGAKFVTNQTNYITAYTYPYTYLPKASGLQQLLASSR